MTIPPLSLWQAFAIGLPLGIAGFAIQEVILRRRAKRGRPQVTPSRPERVPTPAPRPAPPDPPPPAPALTLHRSAGVTPSSLPAAATPAPSPGAVAATAQPQRPASPWLPGLLELESDLDEAIEAIVDFVDAPPRLAGARDCAEQLDRLVPQDRRRAAYAAFVRSLGTDTRPSELQQLAEALGVDLTAQLVEVRREISPAG